VKDGRSSPAPFAGIPVDWAKLMITMAKGYRAGRPIRSHGVKGKNNLAAASRPTAMLGRIVFADIEGGENRSAIRRQVQSEHPPGRVGRGRMTLVNTWEISLPVRGEDCPPSKRNQPA
jgi:hypothetical protein